MPFALTTRRRVGGGREVQDRGKGGLGREAWVAGGRWREERHMTGVGRGLEREV